MKIQDKIRCGFATVEEMRELGRDEVLAVKSSAAKHVRAVTRAPSANVEARTVTYEASNGEQDRLGDVIDPAGWDLRNFQLNPVLLWDHNQSALPLGRVTKARKATVDGRKALITTAQFHGAEKNPMAELVWRMVADGDLPAVSVGFLPLDTVRPKSDGERRDLGVGEYGVYYARAELLELSVVTVGALATALAKKLDGYAERGEASWAVIKEMQDALAPREPRVMVNGFDAMEIDDELVIPAPAPVVSKFTAELVRQIARGVVVQAVQNCIAQEIQKALSVSPRADTSGRDDVAGFAREFKKHMETK